jgi:AGZA family xanthine/uracil permease-like MFS transporter
LLDRYFGLSEQGTDVRTEFIAGVTTFLTMVYIVFVNPIILGKTGMDQGAVFVATCLAAAVSTLVMAFYANYPIALAPGMGINAFFAFTVVLTYNYTWQQALAAVFCSGVLFFLISVFPIRQYVIDAIPQNLKLAVSAGVGLFLGIIALEEAKVIVDHPATLVTLGDLTKPVPALMLLGFVLIAGLNYRRMLGGTLIGILVVTAIGLPFGLSQFNGIVSVPPSMAPTFLQLDFSRVSELTFLIVVFSILFVDVFDNAGTLIGVTHRTGLMKNGKLARMKQALISDSFRGHVWRIDRHVDDHKLHRKRSGCFGGRSHRTDRCICRTILSAGAVFCAARRDGACLCLGGCLALCCLRDGARSRRDRLGGRDRICARCRYSNHNATDLFDCDRHRLGLYHLRPR